MTQVLNIDPNNPQLDLIILAAEVLKNGGLVAFPTETVYGLGADFFNTEALKRLSAVKERPKEKPFTAHIAGLEDLERFKCDIPLFAKELIEQFWPGPLTLIFYTKKSGSIGFRMPNNKIASELIRQSGTVLAAPSANISGKRPATEAKEILNQLGGKIDLILDAGSTQLAKESTVIDFTAFPYKILREGAIPKERIAVSEFNFWKNKFSPMIKKILFVCTGNSCRSVMAEGYLKKRLKMAERDDIEVFSRGMSAVSLPGPTRETIEVLKQEGIDVGAHKPKKINAEDIKKADIIFVMEEFHKDEILEMAPFKKDRVYLLAEFGLWGGKAQEAPLEIMDPIGQPIWAYQESLNLIKNSIERLVKILI